MKGGQPFELTPLGQQLASQAWGHAAATILRFERRLSGPDYHGYVATRICRHVPSYDPELSSIATWADHQAVFACKDAMRANVSIGPRYRKDEPEFNERRPRIYSIEKIRRYIRKPFGSNCDFEPSCLTSFDRPGHLVEEDALDDLCGGLLPRERQIVDALYRDGLTMREAGAVVGVCESVVCRIHQRCIGHLRARLCG